MGRNRPNRGEDRDPGKPSRFGQPLRFVHAPMLHRKIGRGRYHACPIFDLSRQPIRRDRNRHARLIAGDPTAAKSLSYSGIRQPHTVKRVTSPQFGERLHRAAKDDKVSCPSHFRTDEGPP